MNDYKGYISTEHTLWCGTCTRREQVAEPTKRLTAEHGIHTGWRYSRTLGWRCPSCVEKGKDYE